MDTSQTSALNSLHATFQSLLRQETVDRDAVVRQVLFHPLSQAKLQTAASTVLAHLAARRDLKEDVMQEAALILVDRFQAGRIDYEDLGAAAFDSWLWVQWYNACRHGWRRVRPLWRRGMETRDGTRLPEPGVEHAEFAAMETGEIWQQVLDFIARLENESLRMVLSDWAAEISAYHTSEKRNIPLPSVYRLREFGLKSLREYLIGRGERGED